MSHLNDTHIGQSLQFAFNTHKSTWVSDLLKSSLHKTDVIACI